MEYTLETKKSANANLVKELDHSEEVVQDAWDKIDWLEDGMKEIKEKNKKLEKQTTKAKKDYSWAYYEMKHLRKALDDEREKKEESVRSFHQGSSFKRLRCRRRVGTLIRSNNEASNKVTYLKEVLKNVESQHAMEKARVAKIQEWASKETYKLQSKFYLAMKKVDSIKELLGKGKLCAKDF